VLVPRPQTLAPLPFQAALDALRRVQPRREVIVEEGPAPQRLAPHAVTLTADVLVDDDEIATGRFVLLHEPDGHATWGGTFRIVTFARAQVDPDVAVDPLAPEAGWSWLVDALQDHDCAHDVLGGTVTRVSSQSFGELAERDEEAHLEVRASWTPDDAAGRTTGAHFEAWLEALCHMAGLPPLPPGVTPIPSQARRG
jgi:hypothetical protein